MRITMAGLAVLALSVLTPAVHAQQAPSPAGVTSQSASEVIAKAKLDGAMAATNTGGWFGRSVAIGVVTGLIGTAVTYAVAANSSAELPADKQMQVAKESAEYRALFEQSFADQVRSKRKSSALKGGLVGTAVLLVLVGSSGS